jgi:hypothetical protein
MGKVSLAKLGNLGSVFGAIGIFGVWRINIPHRRFGHR